MVKKYVFGKPFCTEAVVKDIVLQDGKIPFFEEKVEKNITLTYQLSQHDVLYGLGESNRGINKRGYLYESFCSDDPSHTEDKVSFYGAHNFLIVDGKERFGIFIDHPGKVSFDCGYASSSELKIESEGSDATIYFIEGSTLKEICKEFRSMIGQSYIPPKWAFGYGQSRWSYMNRQEIIDVAKGYRENKIPLDAIYMDIDYMQSYKDFTVNQDSFPDFKEMVHELKEQGIRLVPIIDAGVKIEEGYDIYEEGVRDGYFCKKENGENFVAAVWPGACHFPDVLNKEARRWFGHKYHRLTDLGIEGFWNDMNEPAIFYTNDALDETIKYISSQKGKNLDLQGVWDLKGKVLGLANHALYYEQFYHEIDGKKIRHDQVHNLYGYYMTRAAGEAFDEISPNKRILLFSRASYIGMHRYGGIWTGDNCSWWSHILLNIKMMPSLNMCGFLYSGADLGGFGGNTSEELLMRWLAVGIFTPLMRNHSALGTRRQELFMYEHIDDFKNLLQLRYALIPYLYSEYMKAALKDEMLIRPLSFDYEKDKHAPLVEDQLMIGESIMIAPVYTQNSTGRYVYLPEDMLFVLFKTPEEKQMSVMKKGHHYIPVQQNEVPVFIKKNHILPLGRGAEFVDELIQDSLELISYSTEECFYELYQDDGFTKEYDLLKNITKLSVKMDDTVFSNYINI